MIVRFTRNFDHRPSHNTVVAYRKGHIGRVGAGDLSIKPMPSLHAEAALAAGAAERLDEPNPRPIRLRLRNIEDPKP